MDWDDSKTPTGGTSVAAGVIPFTFNRQKITHLLMGFRSAAGVNGITHAELKAMGLKIRVSEKDMPADFVDSNPYDMAMFTDLMGGYGLDFSETDKSNVNIVIPVGKEFQNGGLEGSLFVPANPVTAAKFFCYAINDGSNGSQMLRYRTQEATKANMTFSQALALYTRNEVGDIVDLKVAGGPSRTLQFELGRILFARDAKVEREANFARIFANTTPEHVELTPKDTLSVFSVEAYG